MTPLQYCYKLSEECCTNVRKLVCKNNTRKDKKLIGPSHTYSKQSWESAHAENSRWINKFITVKKKCISVKTFLEYFNSYLK